MKYKFLIRNFKIKYIVDQDGCICNTKDLLGSKYHDALHNIIYFLDYTYYNQKSCRNYHLYRDYFKDKKGNAFKDINYKRYCEIRDNIKEYLNGGTL